MMISQLMTEYLDPAAVEIRHREIAQKAYEKWRLSGEPQGQDFDFWLQAESELNAGRWATSHEGSRSAPGEFIEIPIALLEEAPVAIAVWDRSKQIRFSNRRFQSLAEDRREELLERLFAGPGFWGRSADPDVSLAGAQESAPPQVQEISLPGSRGTLTLLAWTFRLSDPHKTALFCTLLSEVPERLELQRSRNLLLQTCRLLSSSSTLQEIATPLLENICSAYQWDIGLLWRLDNSGKALICRAVSTDWEEELKDFCLESFQTEFALGTGLPGKVWRERQSLCLPDLSAEAAQLYRASKLQCGLTSAFLCPIQRKDEFLGVLEFYSLSCREPTIGFQETMASVSSQVAQFVLEQHAQSSLHRRERELQLAKQIQLNCQPKMSLKFSGYQIAGVSLPADSVGGDYFDFFPVCGDRILIAIGDAAGHGFSSALRISEVRAYIRALAMAESSLERIFALTNQYFIDHSESGSFVTLLVVSLDPNTGVLKYNNAGHLSGYVFDPEGDCRLVMPSTSFPIGIAPCAKFPPGPSLQLHRGEWILLFSDGVIDARNKDGKLLGNEGFLEIAQQVGPGSNAQESAQLMLNRVSEFADGPLEDDMTIVIISRDAV
jgi:sigma-B regulation protein RsbU (phosphoserine phosphatase)